MLLGSPEIESPKHSMPVMKMATMHEEEYAGYPIRRADRESSQRSESTERKTCRANKFEELTESRRSNCFSEWNFGLKQLVGLTGKEQHA